MSVVKVTRKRQVTLPKEVGRDSKRDDEWPYEGECRSQ